MCYLNWIESFKKGAVSPNEPFFFVLFFLSKKRWNGQMIYCATLCKLVPGTWCLFHNYTKYLFLFKLKKKKKKKKKKWAGQADQD
jgi:hypothetical protein